MVVARFITLAKATDRAFSLFLINQKKVKFLAPVRALVTAMRPETQ